MEIKGSNGLKVGQMGVVLENDRYRSVDPCLMAKWRSVIRRVASDARKIDLLDIGNEGTNQSLSSALGVQLAAIHVAHRNRTKVLKDPKSRGTSGRSASDWLPKDVQVAIRQVTAVYETYVDAIAPENGI